MKLKYVICFSRFPDILPYNHNRVKLKEPINSMDYINASWITTSTRRETNDDIPTSYSSCSNISFIASQGPLPSSCVHHLQMIHEQKVDIVIMLSNIEEGMVTSKGKKIIPCLE